MKNGNWKCKFFHDWELVPNKKRFTGTKRVCLRCQKVERMYGLRWVSLEEYAKLDKEYNDRKEAARKIYSKFEP